MLSVFELRGRHPMYSCSWKFSNKHPARRSPSLSTHMDRPGDLEVQCTYGNARPSMRSGPPPLPSSPGSTSTSPFPSPGGHPKLVVRLSRLICAAGPTYSMGRAALAPNGGKINARCYMNLVTSQPGCFTDPGRGNTSPPISNTGECSSNLTAFTCTLHATPQQVSLATYLGAEVE